MTEEIKRKAGRPPKITEEHIAQLPENPIALVMAEESASTSIKTEYSPPPVVQNAGEKSSECPKGYFPIETAPKDRKIVVSMTGEDQTCVYWRMRRIVDKKALRYVPHGAWTDDLSRMDIDFEPNYWRPYVASDYIPVPRAK